MIHVISLGIQPKRDITPLIGELKKSPGWEHHIDNTWLIATHETPQELYKRLATHLQPTDYILITELPRGAGYSVYWGMLPKEAWEWIESSRQSGY